MSSRNALLEWLEQIKKLSKARDYADLDLVDKLFELMPLLDKGMLYRHKDFFDEICTPYHKPSPLARRSSNGKIWRCPIEHHKCGVLNRFVDAVISRAEAARKDILWQWFEIIDFMFERPELINPSALDEYIEDKINFVCKAHRKNNPLDDYVRNKFGRYWKDDQGRWRKERRHRW